MAEPDGPRKQQLQTDLRDLIDVVDRRLIELRASGNDDAVRHMEDIRNRACRSLENLQDDPEN